MTRRENVGERKRNFISRGSGKENDGREVRLHYIAVAMRGYFSDVSVRVRRQNVNVFK